MRLTWAPSFVWCCTFHRKMSPTAICTRSRSSASILACVPLPLPWTPIMTYLRTRSGYSAVMTDLGAPLGRRPFRGAGWGGDPPSRPGLAGGLLLRPEREMPFALAAQLGLERAGDQRPVRRQQCGVDEADDV